MKIIIKCKSKSEPNWNGKEFSNHPAKLYNNFMDAANALESYWFCDGAKEHAGTDTREVSFIHLSELKVLKLLAQEKVQH